MGFFDKMLNMNPYEQEMERKRSSLYKVYGDADQRRMTRGMRSGTRMGEELVGQSASEIGDQRRKIAGRIYGAIDEPSMRAKAAAVSGADRMRQLKASQKRGGVAGGAAAGQQYETGFKSDLTTAGIAQEDRIMLEDRARKEAGSAGKAVASQRAAEGGLAVASKKVQPANVRSGGGLTYICTVLKNKGLVTQSQLDKVHKVGFKNLWKNSEFVVWYLENGPKLAKFLNEDSAYSLAPLVNPLVHDVINNPESDQNQYIDVCYNLALYLGLYTPDITRTTKNKLVSFAKMFLFKDTYRFIGSEILNLSKLFYKTRRA